MDKIVIKGGRKLHGTVTMSGAKNAALPIMAATLLGQTESKLSSIPQLRDVRTMVRLLELLGCETGNGQSGQLSVLPSSNPETVAPYDLVKTMRASVLVLGPLVARYGKARVSLPGGCAIGARPIDIHLKGLEAMGAEIELAHGYVEAKANRLHGAKIICDMPTVTGTENLMMAAALANGESVIENAAREPEIIELADVLRAMGAVIEGDGTATIRVQGSDTLQGMTHTVRPDRIETGTFMVGAAMAGGTVTLENVRPQDLDAVTSKLQRAGVTIEATADKIVVTAPDELGPLDITTQPYPGFPTDMQAQFMAMATQATGQTTIREAIFENRFMHVPELVRMGADIRIDGRVAVIRGGTPLSGASVMATDLRASASLVLAGLVAQNTTEVLRVYHLDRGYERIENKLAGLGASIERQPE